LAGRISDASIAAVRERASILDVVGAQVALRPAGSGRLKGLCPFHEEKTPSFSVNPSANLYHCFGCGVGGDIFDFVMRLDNLQFGEAVEHLARSAGVTLAYEGGTSGGRREGGRRQRLVDANAAAAEYYAGQLGTAEAQTGREFLLERGFDAAAAERFGIGYAPGGWDSLTRHLRGRDFTVEELTEAGLSRPGSKGSPIDRFHRRLLWPIRDVGGDVVGFGARRLHDDDPIAAKYLNTPETPLFKKSTLLYGADLARRAIGQRDQVVVVEGYTDVMACHLSGVETAVATCGTAFGSDHVRLLRRMLHDQDEHRAEVVFTFDGDAAGRAAARKALQFEQRFVSQTYVAVDDAGRDPCELRQAEGDAAVRELVARRVPLVEFAIRSTLDGVDLDSAEGRSAGLHASAPLVAGIKDWALRGEYARRLSGWLGMESPEPVIAEVRRLAEAADAGGGSSGPPDNNGSTSEARPVRPRRPASGAEAAALTVEREALKGALQCPAVAGPMFDATEPAMFLDPAHRGLREAISRAGGTSTATSVPAWVAAVSEAAADDSVRSLVTSLAVQPLQYEGDTEHRYVSSVVVSVHERDVTRRVAEVKSRLQRTNPESETEAYNRLFNELIVLEQRKRELRTQLDGAG
jgi:DNA primase